MVTLINAAAIILATFLGIIFKKGLSEKIQKAIMFTLGLGLVALFYHWYLVLLLENGLTSIKD
jgi:uncharacterized membrane protein YqgA involved in biofilm formation